MHALIALLALRWKSRIASSGFAKFLLDRLLRTLRCRFGRTLNARRAAEADWRRVLSEPRSKIEPLLTSATDLACSHLQQAAISLQSRLRVWG
ncbi:hypothetical protein KCV06_g631, partial [Aureobasidium melanogenum]